MATEVQFYLKPGFQRRKAGDPDPEIDLKFIHQYVPWKVFSVSYKRSGGAAGVLEIRKKLISGSEVVMHSEAAVGTSFFKQFDEELEHGEAIHVVTTGVGPLAGADFHEASINWDERQR